MDVETALREVIRDEMRRQAINQSQLAALLGCSTAATNRWLQGGRRISLDVLIRI